MTTTFFAMVVNIQRLWLYGELFADFELDTAKGIKLSPGRQKMQEYLKNVSDPNVINELKISSFHEQASSQNVQIETTATGCKIKFGSPQIVAWASQILPELPQPEGGNPRITGFV
jgi:hypothetical protein